MNILLNSVLSVTYNQLIDFANKNNFWQVFDTAFGTQYNRSLAEILRLQWEAGDFSQLPQIEVLDSSILGSANGAYASSENRIYLSNTFVAGASLAAISGVLLEEIGHFVDAKINQTDSAGDEGAIFAELVQGYSLNTQTLQALKSEDDHATITVNGQNIQVEQQNFTGTNIFGTDTITGSSGDDTISPLRGQDQVDGGAGNDVLVVDYSSNTYTGTSPQGGISSSVNNNGNGGFNGYYFAYDNTNGSYDQVSFSNIERFQITGTGANDNIITGDGNDTINGGNGDDVITGGAGINVIDGGAGIDTITDANFSSATTALSIDDSNTAKNFTLPDGTTITNIERFTGLITGSGNDVINFSQRINKSLNTGNGDDTINAGLGQNQVDGGAGNDVLVVDYSSNTYTGTSPQGGISSSVNNNGNGGFNGYYFAYDNTNGSYDQVSFSNIERFQITGTGANDNIITGDGNDTINGGNGNDTIDAGGGNDTINGVNGASLTPGLGEIDSLTGGAGSDIFILGNATKVYYDDGNTLTNGSNDYADITDLNIGDIIQLQGTSSNYLLAVVGADTQILINKPNTEPDELIGIVRNQTGLSLTGTYFSYVFDNTPPTNQAPTNITLNNSTIAENQAINTVVGNFTTTDPNTGDTFTYSLVSGTGDTNNNSFIIVGNNELQTKAIFDYETKNSYSVRVKTTDQGGLSFEKQLTIGITDVNETPTNQAPTNISLNNSTIAENQAINTVVGNFTTTDPDAGNTFTYTLISGTGDTDNNVFTITNNELKTNSGFDYETKNSYSIRIKTTDQGGLSFEKQLTIGVTDVNEAPVITSPTTANFAENGTGTVYTVIATDVDAGTPLYSLSGTDASLFNISNGNVNFKNAPNFELPSDSGANNVYDINVIASDGSLTATQAVAITVTNVNEVPSNLTLSNSTIAENQAINTVVGNFTTTDPDEGNTFTYTLISGTGDTDNNVFTITNNELKTNSGFDYETKNSYSIRVKTTDQGGLSFEKQLTIGVTDVNETVANLSISPSNVTQTEGNSGTKAFTFTVTRSEDTSGSSSANWALTGSGTNQADVTDFGGTFPTSTVVFAAGETTKTIIVDVLGDTTVEPDEGFTVTLSNPTNATIATATAVGTIENDDDVALVLVSQILGSGVTTVKDAKFTGSSQAVDTFTNSSVGIGITSGIVLSSGKVADIYGNNVDNISTDFSGAGDADLNKLVNGSTKDAAVLEFDFIPTDSFVSFDYVFASEEYKEYVNSQYNDVFGFFVTDTSGITTNIAVIPGTQTPITVNNINDQKNANLYRDNPQSGSGSTYNTKFDGFTSVLTATTPVKPGETYKFKLALADTADSALDSAIFIGKGFSSSSLVASNDSFLVTSASQASFDVLKNDFVSSGKPVILDFNSVSDKGGKVSRDNNQTPTDLSDDKLLYTPPLDFNGIDTFQYTLGDGQNGTATGKVSIEVKNISLAIASTNATQTEGNSGTKAFTFTVTRSEDTSGSSSANWAVTGSGTDQADVTDFGGTLPTGTVGFAAGETTKTIIVDVLGDTTVEPDEGFTVTLSNPTNATITTATAVGTITNDDRTLTPITDYAPNVNISTGLVFSTNGGGNLSLDTNRLSASNEVTGVQNGTKSNFNHLFGLYEVVDAEGGINTEKGVLKPGDSDYALYALTTARVKDFIVQAGSSDTPSTATQLGSGVSLQGNKFYAPFVIANCGTYFPNLQQGVEDFVAAENGDVNRFANAPQYVRDLVATEAGNEFNNAPRFLQEPVAYFSFGSANPDKSPHLRSYGNGVYGFEDLPATATQYSNNDFNDAVFALS